MGGIGGAAMTVSQPDSSVAIDPPQHDAITDVVEVLKRVQRYLDALYTGDTDLFESVLHPRVTLCSGTEDELVTMNRDEYLQLVRSRPSPHSRGDQRRDRIAAVEMSSPTSAHVRVENRYAPKRFVDDLILIRTGGSWWITSKTWHYVLEK